jgi:hypothetical protein
VVDIGRLVTVSRIPQMLHLRCPMEWIVHDAPLAREVIPSERKGRIKVFAAVISCYYAGVQRRRENSYSIL